jgi:hypothetical protein
VLCVNSFVLCVKCALTPASSNVVDRSEPVEVVSAPQLMSDNCSLNHARCSLNPANCSMKLGQSFTACQLLTESGHLLTGGSQ